MDMAVHESVPLSLPDTQLCLEHQRHIVSTSSVSSPACHAAEQSKHYSSETWSEPSLKVFSLHCPRKKENVPGAAQQEHQPDYCATSILSSHARMVLKLVKRLFEGPLV